MKKTLFGFNKKDVYTSDRSVWPPTPSCLWRSRELHTGHHLIGLAKRTAVGGVARDTAVSCGALFHFFTSACDCTTDRTLWDKSLQPAVAAAAPSLARGQNSTLNAARTSVFLTRMCLRCYSFLTLVRERSEASPSCWPPGVIAPTGGEPNQGQQHQLGKRRRVALSSELGSALGPRGTANSISGSQPLVGPPGRPERLGSGGPLARAHRAVSGRWHSRREELRAAAQPRARRVTCMASSSSCSNPQRSGSPIRA